MNIAPNQLEARMIIARQAAARAAIVCRHIRAGIDFAGAMTKDDRSPVTIADYASQAIVARTLGELDPGVPLVAEESGVFLRQPEHAPHLAGVLRALRATLTWPDADEQRVLGAIDRGAGETTRSGFWTLDPIDGTKGFLRGGQYCVSLAYIEDNRVQLGVLACPALSHDLGISPEGPSPSGSTYSAIRGRGAYMHWPDDDERFAAPMLRIDAEPHRPACLAESVESAHTRQDLAESIMQSLGSVGTPVRIDSQCKYALVARGDADVYLRLPSQPGYVERIWDHAAGMLIAQEAGCIVTDLHGHELDFGHGRGLEGNAGVIAATPRLHGRILDAARNLAQPAR